MQEDNTTPVNSAPVAEPAVAVSEPKKGKKGMMILFIVLVLCCVLTLGVGAAVVYFGDQVADDISNELDNTLSDLETEINNELDNLDTNLDTTNGNLTVESGEVKYENLDYSFSLIHPETWSVTEVQNEVEITSDIEGGQINFQALDDPTFVLLEEIDADFCDSFGEGFREGLGDIDSASQFYFELFSLNGNQGCRASGEIVPEVFQTHYIFFNDDTDFIYSIFYTTTDKLVEEKALSDAINSFDFID